MLFVLILLVIVVFYGVAEYRHHLRCLEAIPVRVHVNGTRGKSSVTRLIAAGLRAGGVRTVAKTTGSAARYIHPDGREDVVSRPGPPNIREQLDIARSAARAGARCLVVECMALRPELQWLSEHRMIQSTVGVITNVRPDHLDVMGPTVDDVALALAGTVPRGAACFTAEHDHDRGGVLRETAEEQGSTYRAVAEGEVDQDDIRDFHYIEHRENVALALAVCEHIGVDRKTALEGMRQAPPDPGALTIHRISDDGKEIDYVNAFAANDRESTMAVWRSVTEFRDEDQNIIGIVSMRADRPDRAVQFGEIIARDIEADHYIVTGGLTGPVRSGAKRLGLAASKLTDMENRRATDVYRRVLELTPKRSLVIGIGNIHGAGEKIHDLFVERSSDS